MPNINDMDNKLSYHIEELRKTVLWCVIALAVAYPVTYYFTPGCINALINWCLPKEIGFLNYFTPMEAFIVRLKVSFILSFVVASPYILMKIWDFVLPALHVNERKFIKTAVFFSVFLFVVGIFICVAFILPLLMKFSADFSTPQLHSMIGFKSFINLSGWLILAFGIMFQFPVAILCLIKFDIISLLSIKQKRPYVIVLILILAAILTPPDIVSQLLLGVPTYLLFELSILIASATQKNK